MANDLQTANRAASRWRVVRVALLVVLVLLAGLLVLIRVYPYPVSFPTLPRVTHTSSGIPGDPINIIFIGSQQQISSSFQAAGWLVPDPIDAQSMAKIAAASLSHSTYPTAPVSNLYVFGHPQDLAFELPTNDVANRGHIRLWKSSVVVSGEPVWVGQASYDQGIELSAVNRLPTHHIAAAVDLERDAVGADLAKTKLVVTETTTAFSTPIFAARNGGGDFYESDGDALVVNFTHESAQLASDSGFDAGVEAVRRAVFRVYDLLLTQGVFALGIGVAGAGLLLFEVWPLLRSTGRAIRLRGRRYQQQSPGT
jgi:LssY-like putative type I secretion system component LssY